MIKIAVLSPDILFASMLRGELESINKEYSVKINEYEALEGKLVDDDVGVVVVDLDSLYGTMNFSCGTVIGFSRFEEKLPIEIKNKCKAVLHRPFLIENFRNSVQKIVSGDGEIDNLFVRENTKITERTRPYTRAICGATLCIPYRCLKMGDGPGNTQH